MPTYTAPLADMKFVLRELFDAERAQPLPGGDSGGQGLPERHGQ